MRSSASSPRNLLTSLVLVFPLFIIYQVGVLATLPMMNGADFLTTFLIRNLGLGPRQYLGFAAAVSAVFLIAILALRKTQRFDGRVVIPVILESALYALTMGSVIVLAMTRLFGISPTLAGSGAGSAVGEGSLATRAVMSVGAGVWEETLFRLLLLSGLAFVLEKAVGLARWAAFLLALVLSSLAFSAMHYVPPYGDALRLGSFTFRALAGVCFGLLFRFRGFAVAVYTHMFYDVYVLLIR